MTITFYNISKKEQKDMFWHQKWIQNCCQRTSENWVSSKSKKPIRSCKAFKHLKEFTKSLAINYKHLNQKEKES